MFLSDEQKKEIINQIFLMSAVSEGKPYQIIIRGLPGSGKSHLAREIAEALDCALVDIDHIHMRAGIYMYNVSRHYNEALMIRRSVEMTPPLYDVIYCDCFPYWNFPLNELPPNTLMITLKIPPDLSLRRNKHRCPIEDIMKMVDTWVDVPGEIVFDLTPKKKASKK